MHVKRAAENIPQSREIDVRDSIHDSAYRKVRGREVVAREYFVYYN